MLRFHGFGVLVGRKSAPVALTTGVTATQGCRRRPVSGPFRRCLTRKGRDDCTQINICNVYRFSTFSDRSVRLFLRWRRAVQPVCCAVCTAITTEATSLVVFGGGARKGAGGGGAAGRPRGVTGRRAIQQAATGYTHKLPASAPCHCLECPPGPASALGGRSEWSAATGQSSNHR